MKKPLTSRQRYRQFVDDYKHRRLDDIIEADQAKPTSNFDTESEQLIQAAMAERLAGRTTFIIAHRLSTVRCADLILLMEGGRVTERGPQLTEHLRCR